MRRALGAAALALALPALAGAAAAAGEGAGTPGAYCPLPEGDARPACLEPATRDYRGLFEDLERGEVPGDSAAAVEGDLVGERRYEALSSLAYAYYVLSRRAAADPERDPRIAERLERWNALLGETYRESGDEAFRGALRTAAGDLRERAPAVRVRCTDAEGRVAECDSTEAVVAAVSDARQRTGLRGALTRLVERILGTGE